MNVEDSVAKVQAALAAKETGDGFSNTGAAATPADPVVDDTAADAGADAAPAEPAAPAAKPAKGKTVSVRNVKVQPPLPDQEHDPESHLSEKTRSEMARGRQALARHRTRE